MVGVLVGVLACALPAEAFAIVATQRAVVLELLAREDVALLVRRDALLVLDLPLDVLGGVAWLDVEGDGPSGERLHEDLQDHHEDGCKFYTCRSCFSRACEAGGRSGPRR